MGGVATPKAGTRSGGAGSSGASASTLQPGRAKATFSPRFRSIRADNDGGEKTGKLWEITIVEAGLSLNGFNYKATALKEGAPIFKGLAIFERGIRHTEEGRSGRHLTDAERDSNPNGMTRDQVGRIHDAWWNETAQRIDGLAAIHTDATRSKLKNAQESEDIGEGVESPAFGLSIDVESITEGTDVVQLVRGNSLDMVTRPAAGGVFRRMVASVQENDVETNERLAALEAQIKNSMAEQAKTITTLREQVEAATAPGPVEVIRQALSEAAPEGRRDMVNRIKSMLTEMGFDEAPAADTTANQEQAEKFDRLTEGLREALAGSVDDDLRGVLASLTESVLGDPNEDAKDKTIQALKVRLQEQAIDRELATLAPTLKIVDIDAASTLCDMSKVKVSDDGLKVTGLKESLETLLAEKPYLVQVASTPPAAGSTPPTAAPKPDAATRQHVRLTEEEGVATAKTADQIYAEIGKLGKRADERSCVKRRRLIASLPSAI